MRTRDGIFSSSMPGAIPCGRPGSGWASSNRQDRTLAATRSPLASATRSRGVAIRWRTRLMRHSISPALFKSSASRACKRVFPSSSPMTCWRCWRVPISSNGWLIQRRISRPPMGLRVLSSTHNSDPLTDPLRPVSNSSRLRRVCVSRVIKAGVEYVSREVS